MRTAEPFADLARVDFDEIVEMLARGIGEGAGRSAPLIHRDRINGIVRGRRGARLAAITNGGTIPELGDYQVVAEPDDTVVGSVNEDFAMESMAGDIFLLGSTSWRIRRVEQSTVRVVDAQGAPPTIPFWLGEAPGRTRELSQEVGQLRRDIADGLDDPSRLHARLQTECALPPTAAAQMIDYVRATRDGLGLVPSDRDVVYERFFDDSGGMQLVVHAPFGQRVNRAWGLALRKRFCVRFDFELQAAANDDAILLSLGPQHSFPLEETFRYVTSRNVAKSLRQAILYVPLFPTRWRWNVTRALAVPRQRGGKRVPPFLQRMKSDDLLAAVFPEQVGCQENVTGPLEIPDHPLIEQTVRDCLTEAMALPELVRILEQIEAGEIRLHARDTVEPSPMAHEIVSGKPYTYLDDAPIEERRTRAVSLRRALPESARDLGQLDADAIARVAEEAWPDPRNAEEAHDALLGLVAVAEPVVGDWLDWLHELRAAGRALQLAVADSVLWAAAEHLPALRLLYPEASVPDVRLPAHAELPVDDREAARRLLLRGHSEVLGPFHGGRARRAHGTDGRGRVPRVGAARGGRLRAARTVHAGPGRRGVLRSASAGPHAPRHARSPATRHRPRVGAGLHALPHRMARARARRSVRGPRGPAHRHPAAAGIRSAGGRLGERAAAEPRAGLPAQLARRAVPERRGGVGPPVATAPQRRRRRANHRLHPGRHARDAHHPGPAPRPPAAAGGRTRRGRESASPPTVGAGGEIHRLLEARGALFFDEVAESLRRLPTDVEEGLRALIGGGWVASDGFHGVRALAGRRRRGGWRRRGGRHGLSAAASPPGRWSLLAAAPTDEAMADDLAERVAHVMLGRYGVVFRDLRRREAFTPPWRDVLRALRRLEARGAVRGGRFVTGFVGEQYALPEAVTALRRHRAEAPDGRRVRISAVDPLNLTGIVTPGERVPAYPGRSIELIDGLPSVEHESIAR